MNYELIVSGVDSRGNEVKALHCEMKDINELPNIVEEYKRTNSTAVRIICDIAVPQYYAFN